MSCEHCEHDIGIEVFYDTDTREYQYRPEIYGHYQLQLDEDGDPNLVNGRVYFKKANISFTIVTICHIGHCIQIFSE